jgi:GDP-L-fucose synthase
VDDLGEACVFSLRHCQPRQVDQPFLNVGTVVDLTILELAEGLRSTVARFREDLN